MTTIPETNRSAELAELAKPTELAIAGISEPVISRYFETLNAADYPATATLFAADGVMCPPFDAEIVGEEAIATYLKAEAKGMMFHPREGLVEPLDGSLNDRLDCETHYTHYKVTGKVQTPFFGVNVNWLFVLNPQSEILSVKVKLLASPQELLSMKQ